MRRKITPEQWTVAVLAALSDKNKSAFNLKYAREQLDNVWFTCQFGGRIYTTEDPIYAAKEKLLPFVRSVRSPAQQIKANRKLFRDVEAISRAMESD